MRRRLALLLVAGVLAGGPLTGSRPAPPAAPDALLETMAAEMQRAAAELTDAGSAPLYFLAYRLTDLKTRDITASLGTITGEDGSHDRYLDVGVRVGSMAFDNTRTSRTLGAEWRTVTRAPLTDDALALRIALWDRTEQAFRDAQDRYAKLQTEARTESERSDPSGDFSPAGAGEHTEPLQAIRVDAARWRERLERLSGRFLGHPHIYRSQVAMQTSVTGTWITTTEGARVRRSEPTARLIAYASAKADDGMDLYLYETWDEKDPGGLPSESEAAARIDAMIADLEALRTAPVVDPYSGPAILDNRAAGVFFHEVFGHRIEGHRQKSEDEGQTFRGKVGQAILPAFMSIYDDPTLQTYRGRYLKGHYLVDDQGVPAGRVDLVEQGVFERFLMSRSPIEGFPASNGHGRAEYGYPVASRQGNLIIESSNRVSYQQLRQRLIELIKEQGKPYGLIFADISGGFTLTGRSLPQSFKVQPLLVRRVYADGRPDELVRGVDLVGTPLTSLSKIVLTGDDPAVFNGYCGAESGSVPVSAVAPSILVSEIEVEKQAKALEAPPVLPAPPDEEGAGAARGPAGIAGDVLMAAMQDEMGRTMAALGLPDAPTPYQLTWRVRDRETWDVRAYFGALRLDQTYEERLLTTELRVGDHELDNTGFVSLTHGPSRPGLALLPGGEGYAPLRRGLWLAADATYREALGQYTAKTSFLEGHRVEDRPPDYSQALPMGRIAAGEPPDVDRDAWRALLEAASAVFRDRRVVTDGEAMLTQRREVRRVMSSDGALVREPAAYLELIVSARGEAPDGAPLSAYRVWRAVDPGDLPDRAAVLAAARDVADELDGLAAAPQGEAYVGPVLFEGQAAPAFFTELLATQVCDPRAPLLEEDTFGRFYDVSGDLTNRLNRRILPETVSVKDDPSVPLWDGHPLLGHYVLDQEGVEGTPLDLVVDGWLRTLPMSRTPTKELDGTNGHARGTPGEAASGTVSNVYVTSSAPAPPDSLTARLLGLARLSESPYGLLVTRLHEPSIQARVDREGLVQQRVNDAALASPMTVWRVYAADGRRERVRGYRFEEMGPRSLKDIVALGGKPTLFQTAVRATFGEGVPVSVIAPDLLLEEAVLTPVGGRRATARYLTRPLPPTP